MDITTGSHSAGAEIDHSHANLYVPKCGRVLINLPDSRKLVVINVEAADGLASVVYESVGRTVGRWSSLRITIGEA